MYWLITVGVKCTNSLVSSLSIYRPTCWGYRSVLLEPHPPQRVPGWVWMSDGFHSSWWLHRCPSMGPPRPWYPEARLVWRVWRCVAENHNSGWAWRQAEWGRWCPELGSHWRTWWRSGPWRTAVWWWSQHQHPPTIKKQDSQLIYKNKMVLVNPRKQNGASQSTKTKWCFTVTVLEPFDEPNIIQDSTKRVSWSFAIIIISKKCVQYSYQNCWPYKNKIIIQG